MHVYLPQSYHILVGEANERNQFAIDSGTITATEIFDIVEIMNNEDTGMPAREVIVVDMEVHLLGPTNDNLRNIQ
jgi:hypothetical protein